jgi:outer membrane protein assembly factor BamB
MLCGVPPWTEPFTVDRYDRRHDGGAAAVPLIDLDLVGPPEREGAPRGPFARRPVLAWLAVAAVLAVAACGGSADAGAGRLDKVLTFPAVQDGHLVIGSGAVFAAARNADGSTEIQRRSLDGRGAEWSVPAAGAVEQFTVRPAAQVLLASMAGDATTALDMRTGRMLWRHATGYHVVTSDDAAVFIDPPDNAGPPQTIEVVELRTGRTVWSRTAESHSEWHIDGAATPTDTPQYVVNVEPGGAVTTFRLADGAVLARRALRLPASGAIGDNDEDFTQTSIVGDALFHARSDRRRRSLSAFSIDTLQPRWRTDNAAVGPVTSCGAVVCVNEIGSVTALDPRTSAVRWTAAPWTFATALDDRLIAFTGQHSDSAALLDPGTGKVVQRLGTGWPLERSTRYFLRQDDSSPGRPWVVDMGTGRQAARVLGRVEDSTSMSCDADGPYLACMSPIGTVTAWRVRGA